MCFHKLQSDTSVTFLFCIASTDSIVYGLKVQDGI